VQGNISIEGEGRALGSPLATPLKSHLNSKFYRSLYFEKCVLRVIYNK